MNSTLPRPKSVASPHHAAPRYQTKQLLSVTLRELKADTELREVTGYAATWDLDSVMDKILEGAFDETIQKLFTEPLNAKGAPDIRVLWQHYEPIGVLLECRPDAKGLFIRAKISRTRLGDDVLQLLADKAVDRMSIGYLVQDAEYTAGGVRLLKKLDLLEVSFVTFPANDRTGVTSVKSIQQQLSTKSEEELAGILDDLAERVVARAHEKGLLAAAVAGDPDPAPPNPLEKGIGDLEAFAQILPAEQKAGRAISQVNADRITTAYTKLTEVMTACGLLAKEDDKAKKPVPPAEEEDEDEKDCDEARHRENPTGDPQKEKSSTEVESAEVKQFLAALNDFGNKFQEATSSIPAAPASST